MFLGSACRCAMSYKIRGQMSERRRKEEEKARKNTQKQNQFEQVVIVDVVDVVIFCHQSTTISVYNVDLFLLLLFFVILQQQQLKIMNLFIYIFYIFSKKKLN